MAISMRSVCDEFDKWINVLWTGDLTPDDYPKLALFLEDQRDARDDRIQESLEESLYAD